MVVMAPKHRVQEAIEHRNIGRSCVSCEHTRNDTVTGRRVSCSITRKQTSQRVTTTTAGMATFAVWVMTSTLFSGCSATQGDRLVTSYFHDDTEGWTATHNAGVQPEHVHVAGNFELSVVDGSLDGGRLEAPPKFLGDISSSYLGSLRYSLHYSKCVPCHDWGSTRTYQDDVILTANVMGASVVLQYDIPAASELPAFDETDGSDGDGPRMARKETVIPFDPFIDYHDGYGTWMLVDDKGSSRRPHPDVFINALQNVTSISIRWDYVSGVEKTGGLDDVVMLEGIDPPIFESVSPMLGPSSGGTTLTIKGQNLRDRYHNQKCRLITRGSGGVERKNVTFSATFLDEHTATCVTPSFEAGDHAIQVCLDDFLCSHQSSSFSMYVTPYIRSVTPTLGPLGGDTHVQFDVPELDRRLEYTCKFGSTVVQAYWHFGSLYCVSPPCDAPGVVTVALSANQVDYTTTTEGGDHVVQFQYYTSPVLTDLVPKLFPTAGGMSCFIEGRGMVYSSDIICRVGSLLYNGTYLTDVNCHQVEGVIQCEDGGKGKIECPVPPAGGDGEDEPITSTTDLAREVVVSLNGGQHWLETTSGNSLYISYFGLKRIYPASGGTAGGTPVTMIGVGPGLDGSVSEVLYGNVMCKFGNHPPVRADEEEFTKGRVVCYTPPDEGSHKVSVTLNGLDYTEVRDELSFTYYGVSRVSPKQGYSGGGNLVTVWGSGLDNPLAKDVRCVFGENSSPATYSSMDGAVVCLSPAGEDTVSVEVSWEDGLGVSTGSTQRFEYMDLGEAFLHLTDVSQSQWSMERNGASNSVVISTDGVLEASDGADVFARLICPRAYRGNQEMLYNGELFYTIEYLPCDVCGTKEFERDFPDDVILFGPHMSLQYDIPGDQTNGIGSPASSFAIPVTDTVSGWSITGDEERTVTQDDFLSVLSDLKGVTIRVDYLEDRGKTFRVGHVEYRVGVIPVRVRSFSPSLGPSVGGTVITIEGIGFEDTGSEVCRFCDEIVEAKVWSSKRVTCKAPKHFADDCEVAFGVQGDKFFSNHQRFTFYSINVAELSPREGPSIGSIEVQVTGAGFFNSSHGVTCKFGEIASIGHYYSNSLVTCEAPAGSGDTEVMISFNGADFHKAGQFSYFPYEKPTVFTSLVPFKVNPEDPLTLEGGAVSSLASSSGTTKIRVVYAWEVVGVVGGAILDLSDPAIVEGNQYEPSMTIKANCLMPGAIYTFRLRATDVMSGYSSPLEVRVNVRPQGGLLLAHPVQGLAYQTNFDIVSYDWRDDDYPLQFTTYLTLPIATDEEVQLLVHTSTERVPGATTSATDHEWKSFLPWIEGSKSVQVSLEVEDRYGGKAKRDVEVQVSRSLDPSGIVTPSQLMDRAGELTKKWIHAVQANATSLLRTTDNLTTDNLMWRRVCLYLIGHLGADIQYSDALVNDPLVSWGESVSTFRESKLSLLREVLDTLLTVASEERPDGSDVVNEIATETSAAVSALLFDGSIARECNDCTESLVDLMTRLVEAMALPNMSMVRSTSRVISHLVSAMNTFAKDGMTPNSHYVSTVLHAMDRLCERLLEVVATEQLETEVTVVEDSFVMFATRPSFHSHHHQAFKPSSPDLGDRRVPSITISPDQWSSMFQNVSMSLLQWEYNPYEWLPGEDGDTVFVSTIVRVYLDISQTDSSRSRMEKALGGKSPLVGFRLPRVPSGLTEKEQRGMKISCSARNSFLERWSPSWCRGVMTEADFTVCECPPGMDVAAILVARNETHAATGDDDVMDNLFDGGEDSSSVDVGDDSKHGTANEKAEAMDKSEAVNPVQFIAIAVGAAMSVACMCYCFRACCTEEERKPQAVDRRKPNRPISPRRADVKQARQNQAMVDRVRAERQKALKSPREDDIPTFGRRRIVTPRKKVIDWLDKLEMSPHSPQTGAGIRGFASSSILSNVSGSSLSERARVQALSFLLTKEEKQAREAAAAGRSNYHPSVSAMHYPMTAPPRNHHPHQARDFPTPSRSPDPFYGYSQQPPPVGTEEWHDDSTANYSPPRHPHPHPSRGMVPHTAPARHTDPLGWSPSPAHHNHSHNHGRQGSQSATPSQPPTATPATGGSSVFRTGKSERLRELEREMELWEDMARDSLLRGRGSNGIGFQPTPSPYHGQHAAAGDARGSGPRTPQPHTQPTPPTRDSSRRDKSRSGSKGWLGKMFGSKSPRDGELGPIDEHRRLVQEHVARERAQANMSTPSHVKLPI